MKNKLILKIIAALIILLAVAFLVFNQNGLIRFFEVRNELKKLEVDIQSAQLKLDSLEKEIDSLKTSKDKIEKVSREKFHMMKKNEKSFLVEEK